MAILLVLVLCVGLIVYSETVKPIGIIENVKRALEEMMQSSTSDVKNVTTIDVTGIELGKETEHEHVYKTMYDEEKHWEECIICNEKRNEVVHSFTITWALGYESCHSSNFYTKTCSCGYSETGYKPCVWDGKSYDTGVSYHAHMPRCSVCNTSILHSYYYLENGEWKLNPGQKGDFEEYPQNINQVRCHKANGELITCGDYRTMFRVWL